MLHVQRIAGGMYGGTVLPPVTDPLLQGLWRLAVDQFVYLAGLRAHSYPGYTAFVPHSVWGP